MTRMKKTVMWLAGLLAAGLCQWTIPSANADVRLPNVIGSNMVLQRDAELPFWGWADAGEEVTVSIGSESAKVTADDNGMWMVKLPAMKAGGPHSVTVKGKNTLKLSNVLVGEVWVCSGQSNMEWRVRTSVNPEKEIADAKYPKIRLFHIPRTPAGSPQNDVNAAWKECSPETIPDFSAVAYFFGRKIHKDLDVPVGLINTSWGGTRIEPWTTIDGFRSVPSLVALADRTVKQHDDYVKAAAAAKGKGADAPKDPLENRGAPTGLYNGMIHPIVPFAIRGALWYQGESNRAEGVAYEQKMHALINGWRQIWHRGDFPFLFVQLAPFKYGGDVELLPQIWEAQTKTLELPNTGMAVTTDITNLTDIHPRNKQDVGKRLALWALANTYGKKDLVYSGPLYDSMSVEDGGKVRLKFKHVGSGLAARGGKPLSWFQIAGKDGEFVDADARIDGDSVIVSSDKVKEPTDVRFGWHQEAEPNLMNKEGLPASPFRTGK